MTSKLCFFVKVEPGYSGEVKSVKVVQAFEIRHLDTARRTLNGKSTIFGLPFKKEDITAEKLSLLPDIFVVFDTPDWTTQLSAVNASILEASDYYLQCCKFSNNYFSDVA